MSKQDAGITKVKIFNQSYKVIGHGDSQYVEKLAEYVDSKMKKIAQETPVVDSLKVAILAALNIADDYHQVKAQLDELNRAIAEKSSHCAELLDQILP
jgi:cell division protein ZapA